MISSFAQHFLDLVEFKYKPLPEIEVLHTWLRHLEFDIRPSMLKAWTEMAELLGFSLGNRIQIARDELYAVRMRAFPLYNFVEIDGFGVKKDGSPSQAAVSVQVQQNSKVKQIGGKLSPKILRDTLFEGTTRLERVEAFLKKELKKLC